MIKSIVDIAPLISDEMKAGEMIERLRWPDGVTCPHCDHDKVYVTKGSNPDGPGGPPASKAGPSTEFRHGGKCVPPGASTPTAPLE